MPLMLPLATAARQAVVTSMAWIGVWSAPPVPPSLPTAPSQFASPSFKEETVVQYVRVSGGGRQLRLRFTNELGTQPLNLTDVTVSIVGRGDVAGPIAKVTFADRSAVVVPVGAPMLSDPVDLVVPPLAMLRVTTHFPEQTGPCACHARGEQLADVYAGSVVSPEAKPVRRLQQRVFLSGVEVLAPRGRRVIVAFGDSITDGFGSAVGLNRRWPDVLAERLDAARLPVSVVNAGISGNRLTSSGPTTAFGEPALARFDRDVLSIPGATDLIVLEGINDIGAQPTPEAAKLIAAYRQLIARAHGKGLRVILGTILPYEGAGYFRQDGERVRQAVNRWILSTSEADGVVDFAAAIADSVHPTRLRADLQIGDHLHPNDAGYHRMADAIDLSRLTSAIASRRHVR